MPKYRQMIDARDSESFLRLDGEFDHFKGAKNLPADLIEESMARLNLKKLAKVVTEADVCTISKTYLVCDDPMQLDSCLVYLALK